MTARNETEVAAMSRAHINRVYQLFLMTLKTEEENKTSFKPLLLCQREAVLNLQFQMK